VNGRTYTFGTFPTTPGIQTLEVFDNTDQLIFGYQRFGIDFSEVMSLRFISAIDFLTSTAVPTSFDFTASGIGLFPVGFFEFDLPNGDSVDARFSIDSGFARIAGVAEPGTLGTVAISLLGLAVLRRRLARRNDSDLAPSWDRTQGATRIRSMMLPTSFI
jgi:hypothetical protein